ncbi:pep-cterm sorting domain-containing protein [Anaeramoeba ignava]|uniref:Pep-cterm sorting domain-containing protein n=1 Tax=Anaeramoeba ignava TaxID=1746090 RepID=A0A9Q0LQ11_ANAIG|nr:pep-cterm sorting domain-containing protein [Anaeramoeba ignava]
METYLNLEKLSNDLKNLFQNQNQEETYFDFEIICEQNQETKQVSFKTHKSILSSRSQYFKSLFNSKMKEFQENKLILKDVSFSTISSILNYFYSGKIEINLQNAIEILFFSSKYLIDELIELCSNFIKKNLKIESVVDVLKLSEAMNFNKLMDSSYQFISENFKEFAKTPFFLGLEENNLNSILLNDEIPINEFEMFQSIIKWGKHKSNINQEKRNKKLDKKEKEQIQIQISNVIDKIRFIDFSKQEIEDTLKQDLIPNQISQKLFEFQKLQNDQKKHKNKLDQFIENENRNQYSFIFKTRLKFESTIIQEKEHLNQLKEWINDNEFFSKMKRGFSAKRDGFNCKKWHLKCDNKGKTLVIIKTKDNYIFGGFTSIGWKGDILKWDKKFDKFEEDSDEDSDEDSGDEIDNEWIVDSTAFIFSLRNDKNNRKPEKFPVRKTQEKFAIWYDQFHGPGFGKNRFGSGAGDISLNNKLQPGYSNFGNCYNLPNGIKWNTDKAKRYLAGSWNNWVVDELETFFI